MDLDLDSETIAETARVAAMVDIESIPSSPGHPHLPHSASTSRLSSSFKHSMFLPAGTEPSALSTRGQNLPNLLSRRPSTLRSSERRLSADSDDDVESFRHGLMMAFERDRESERRASVGAAVLNTPQMRSMRLIGNNNPRYRW